MGTIGTPLVLTLILLARWSSVFALELSNEIVRDDEKYMDTLESES